VQVRARAKVNLGLEVLGRRADGYHELRSLMWAIELADRVTLEARGTGIALECAAADVPRTSDNLAWRAAELVRRETGATAGLRIRIDKRIPVAAGLGGGSTDAAAVLAGLGCLQDRRLDARRRGSLAVALGMDVPFFLGRSPALAQGRGEELRPVAASGDLSLVLVNPGFPLATREVYARVEPGDYGDGRRVDALVTALRRGAAAIAATVTNGLERAAGRLWPGLGEVKAALLEAGCLAALMSGSGPTVVGIAPSRGAALRVRDRLSARPWRLWVTRTVTGPVLTIRDARAAGARARVRP
jgi:4-diphosphocytidyl-2-C-methyl-D-erythritol kinase